MDRDPFNKLKALGTKGVGILLLVFWVVCPIDTPNLHLYFLKRLTGGVLNVNYLQSMEERNDTLGIKTIFSALTRLCCNQSFNLLLPPCPILLLSSNNWKAYSFSFRRVLTFLWLFESKKHSCFDFSKKFMSLRIHTRILIYVYICICTRVYTHTYIYFIVYKKSPAVLWHLYFDKIFDPTW